MDKNINELWIITESGIVIFQDIRKLNVEKQIFGALISALHTYAKSITRDGMSGFSISDRAFTILRTNGFIFVCGTPLKKEKKAQKYLEYIKEKFFEKYSPEILKDWDGDLNLFANFHVDF